MNIRRQLQPIHRRIRNITARGVVSLSDASKLLQTLQLTVLKDEVLDGVEHFEPHGFTSRPKAGAEAILLCPGGNRSSAITIMVSDRRVRIKDLGEGEVAIYDDTGNTIVLKQNGSIQMNSPTAVDIVAPDVTIDGNLSVTGDVSDANGSMQEMRDIYNAHGHPTAPLGPVSTPTTSMT